MPGFPDSPELYLWGRLREEIAIGKPGHIFSRFQHAVSVPTKGLIGFSSLDLGRNSGRDDLSLDVRKDAGLRKHQWDIWFPTPWNRNSRYIADGEHTLMHGFQCWWLYGDPASCIRKTRFAH